MISVAIIPVQRLIHVVTPSAEARVGKGDQCMVRSCTNGGGAAAGHAERGSEGQWNLWTRRLFNPVIRINLSHQVACSVGRGAHVDISLLCLCENCGNVEPDGRQALRCLGKLQYDSVVSTNVVLHGSQFWGVPATAV
eukprot:CAMPEP_0184303164 /NCGR_PEP_ID=MMETSP1049-20130417/12957_1 /TAXON_ID=77928 /ORGANISM="Proteomonas sulcata, Strain CCMP704" /LENGTH=137 /DNA_ID=CAMNT_0026614621 /DNA_START=137 /DNA_END=550 /DNA_ORIENTATION=+